MEGWIKLHRKILDNPVVNKDPDHLAVWIYLLLNATHKERDVIFEGKRFTLKTGELVTGRRKIAAEMKVSESKVYRILKTFEIEQQIEQRTDRQKSVISILQWDEYQKSEQDNEQRVNNDRTTSEQRLNTIQECKNDKNERSLSYLNKSLKDEALDHVVNDEARKKLASLRKTINKKNGGMC